MEDDLEKVPYSNVSCHTNCQNNTHRCCSVAKLLKLSRKLNILALHQAQTFGGIIVYITSRQKQTEGSSHHNKDKSGRIHLCHAHSREQLCCLRSLLADKLEMTVPLATQYVLHRHHSVTSLTGMLNMLGWKTRTDHMADAKLCMMYRIVNGLVGL